MSNFSQRVRASCHSGYVRISKTKYRSALRSNASRKVRGLASFGIKLKGLLKSGGLKSLRILVIEFSRASERRPTDANLMREMENKQTVSAADTQDNSMMKPIDQRAHIKGRSDILTRRLKNRERQRRYRARKRLEAETKKSSVVRDVTPITPQEEEPRSQEDNHNFMTRVYCNRNWKKDARRAHAPKREEVTPNGTIDHISKLTSEPEAARLASGKAELTPEREIQSGSPGGVVNNETPRTVLSRRDWKAEARKKKN